MTIYTLPNPQVAQKLSGLNSDNMNYNDAKITYFDI